MMGEGKIIMKSMQAYALKVRYNGRREDNHEKFAGLRLKGPTSWEKGKP
jgi:hypothetical protein